MASLKRKIPADISDEMRDKIRKMAVDAFIALGCSGVSRIDFMIDMETNNVYFNEINTIPGSLAFYLWENDGMPYRELIDRMISCAEKAHADKNRANYAYTSDILKNATFGAKGAKGAKGTKA